MKYQDEIKELLINNTIHLIAEGGFEKATVKELTTCGGTVHSVKMNDVYIYRLFGSKEKLYKAAFIRLDDELYDKLQDSYNVAMKKELGFKERIFDFFANAWNFILGNEERCRCYVRYYYSIYFDAFSIQRHQTLFSPIVSKMSPAFKEEADVSAILHTAFTTMLNFAIRVYNGEILNDEENRPHIFNVLYCMMATYFKDSQVTDGVGR